METFGFDDVTSPFGCDLLRFAAALQVLVGPGRRRAPQATIALDAVKALPPAATAAEFLLLRSILVEFAVRAFAPSGARPETLVPLAQAPPGSDLAVLFTRCVGPMSGLPAEPAAIRDLRVNRASALIAERCREPLLAADQIAHAVGISPGYLCKLLHTCCGCGFRVARRRARVQLAATELECSFRSIKEIATRLGYSSTSQLDRDFKAQHGISPSEYRRRVLTAGTDILTPRSCARVPLPTSRPPLWD